MVGRLTAYLAEQHGLAYRPQAPVVGCEVRGGTCRVRDARGRGYEAAQVVVCTGSDVKQFFPEVFFASDLEVVKLQMLETVPQPGLALPGGVLTGLTIRRYEIFRACPSFPRLRSDHLDPRLAAWGIHLLFKQALDGAVIVGDSHAYRDARDADALGFDLDGAINDLLLHEAQRIFDLPTWQLRRAWYGLYAQCKTGEAFQHTVDGRIHLVTGIGGKGMTSSAAFAEAHVARIFALGGA